MGRGNFVLQAQAGAGNSSNVGIIGGNHSTAEHQITAMVKKLAVESIKLPPPQVKALTHHPAFTRSNPNRLRALVGVFSQANQLHFHDASGAGYGFLGDEVLTLDPDNPQVAARIVQALGNWRRFDRARQALMKAQLQRIRDTKGLSTNTFEMVSKSLGDAP